jgi:X-X-X-Leu-X-X-Gly heptad repeat protein
MSLSETGSAELAAGLSQIASGLDQLDGAANNTVTILVARARRLTPVKTGALSASITGHGVGSTATVGTSLSYGLPVHFGVPSHNQQPRPFLFQAVTAETARIVDAYTADVNRLIEQKV